MKKTVSIKNIDIKSNSRAEKIYPIQTYDKNGSLHKTIGLKLTKDQAIELATNLLIGSKKWDTMNLTAFRDPNSINVTVTSRQNPNLD